MYHVEPYVRLASNSGRGTVYAALIIVTDYTCHYGAPETYPDYGNEPNGKSTCYVPKSSRAGGDMCVGIISVYSSERYNYISSHIFDNTLSLSTW